MRESRRGLRSAPGPWLLWSTACVALFALVVPFIEPLAHVFGFVALPAHLVAAIVAVVIGYICVTELAKRRFWQFRRMFEAGRNEGGDREDDGDHLMSPCPDSQTSSASPALATRVNISAETDGGFRQHASQQLT